MNAPFTKNLITPLAAAIAAMIASASAHAQEGEPGEASTPTAGYDDGLFIQSDDGAHRMEIQGRVQPRFTYENDTEALTDSPQSGDMFFTVQRARVAFKGHAYTPDLTYKFQADFGLGAVSLKDLYVDYALTKGALHLRAGQYKRPFSRQQLTSSGKQEFVDRALTDEAFGAGRDVGVMVHNGYMKTRALEWAAGLFNGNGSNVVPDGRFNPAAVARVGYNHGGIEGYSEADLEGGPLRFAVAASAQAHLDGTAEGDNGLRGEVDFMLKVNGLSATGAVYMASPLDETADDAVGFHAQAGYVLVGGWQPAVRFASHMPAGDNNDESEMGICLSRYMERHRLKWQADMTYGTVQTLDDKGAQDSTASLTLRAQVQMVF